MLHTPTDEEDRVFFVLPASAELDVSGAHSPDEARWCVHVSDPANPLAGLTAYGDTLPAARDNLAALAWTNVMGGELLDGIHVLLTTSTRYDARALAVVTEGAA